jgi:hypothetical protein
MTSPPRAWWSPQRLSVGQACLWRIGPATIVAERRRHEWRVAHGTGEDPLDDTLVVAEAVAPNAAPTSADAVSLRFSFESSPAEVRLEPRLADRDMVIRPADPLTVPAGETTQLYVSTPLWFAVATVQPRHVLTEAACYRPSDTWFGPSPVEGELCYASRTTGRLELAEMPVRPHRAITPVRIRNRAKDALVLERIKVPVPLLPLMAGPRGLWTPRIVLTRTEGAERADVQIEPKAPEGSDAAERVAEPRRKPDASVSLRSFGRWLGLGAPT